MASGRRFSLAILLLLAGCSSQTIYVVLRDVPKSPSFTVFPANDYVDQVEFANNVEAYIIRAGIKVVSRPASKFVETKKEAAKAEGTVERTGASAVSRTEKYYELEATDADYVVYSYAESKQLRILRKATKEIVATFDLKSRTTGEESLSLKKEASIVYETLRNLRMPVRPNPDE